MASALPDLLRLLRRLAAPALLALLALLAAAGAASASEPRLVLNDELGEIDAWPVATMLADPDGRLDVKQVLQRSAEFRPPATPHANLGTRRDTVWLRIPLTVPTSESGRWLLDIDYPSLDRVDVHVVSDGLAVQQLVLGDQLPARERPMASRSHAAALVLEPGLDHELLLRVSTTSAMIVPVALVRAERFHERDAAVQLVQGLLTGIGLCLMLYSLSHWLALRDPTFLFYALTVGSITLFFFAYYGLGAQHLWGGNPWMTANMAPLMVLWALVGGLLFLDRTLMVAALQPRLSRLLKLASALAGVVALAFMAGLIDYRLAQLASTVLGPTPIVLGLPAAWLRARQGDRVAIYVVAGWGLYSVGIVVMALLLRGLIDSNGITQHAFQAGAMVEMLMWLRALGVRGDELRHYAERVGREREALRSLAHTDPLTGLPNRRGLQLELQAALQQASPEAPLAVFLLDLDGFKAVNDRLGHDAGDELLKAVAERLRSQLRARDLVARLGGDEFVIVAPVLGGDEDARRIGEKLLDAFQRPFTVRQQLARVGLTIGYALAPLDGADEASLLKRADAAMYAGKQAGKHCLRRGQASVGLAGA